MPPVSWSDERFRPEVSRCSQLWRGAGGTGSRADTGRGDGSFDLVGVTGGGFGRPGRRFRCDLALGIDRGGGRRWGFGLDADEPLEETAGPCFRPSGGRPDGFADETVGAQPRRCAPARSRPARGRQTSTGTNCSVRPMPSASTNTLSIAPRRGWRELAAKLAVAGLAQSALRARPGDSAIDLRHPRGRRAGARAIGKDVEVGQPGLLDQPQGVLEHRVGFGGKAGDEVGAEHHARAAGARTFSTKASVSARCAGASCA